MQDLADELGVTESRISQMRKEALLLMGEALRTAGIAAAGTGWPADDDDGTDPRGGGSRAAARKSDGVAARRRATYVASVLAASDYRARVSPTAYVVAADAS
jgi:RNA polymerase sigma factor for flagellar operon FliA